MHASPPNSSPVTIHSRNNNEQQLHSNTRIKPEVASCCILSTVSSESMSINVCHTLPHQIFIPSSPPINGRSG